MQIKLVRHGESVQNIGRLNPGISGDFDNHPTDAGCKQAENVSNIIDPGFIKTSLVYCSPYRRARKPLLKSIIILESPWMTFDYMKKKRSHCPEYKSTNIKFF